MQKYITLIVLILSLFACENAIEEKPMKYNRHGEDFSCTGYYLNEQLIKVLCFSDNRDTVLLEDYVDGIRNGKSELRYPSGQIRQIRNYIDGNSHGISREYYENGNLKSYKYNEVKNDTSFLIYEKQYDEQNDLSSLRFPIRFTTDSDGDFKVGEKYQLYIHLLYSEYDSVHCLGFIDAAPLSSVSLDTIAFNGTTQQIQFTPLEIGKHKITGTYYEIDASKPPDLDIGYAGYREWEFEYDVIE